MGQSSPKEALRTPYSCSLTGFESPEMTNRGGMASRGGISAQSTQKPQLPLSKANSKQAESVLAEKSPRLSPVGSVERQLQVCSTFLARFCCPSPPEWRLKSFYPSFKELRHRLWLSTPPLASHLELLGDLTVCLHCTEPTIKSASSAQIWQRH